MKKVCASEQNMKVAFINVIPAIIYAVVLSGQFLGDLSSRMRFAVSLVFIVVYMALTLMPYASFITNVASAIIYIGLIWVICGKASSQIAVILLKIFTAVFIAMVELSIAVNMALKN